MTDITEMLKGFLEGCILEIIAKGETYSYEITQTLRTMGFEEIIEGTVYTVTMRLEKKGLVDIEKQKSSRGPMRKFYKLNKKGQKELERFWEKWEFLSEKIELIRREKL
ncbi:MAG: PadR family transcriptional regulator [Lactovum sp.]